MLLVFHVAYSFLFIFYSGSLTSTQVIRLTYNVMNMFVIQKTLDHTWCSL